MCFYVDHFYIKTHLEILDTLLLIGGIHIGGSMTKHLGKLKEKQATEKFSIQDYVELRRICTRKLYRQRK